MISTSNGQVSTRALSRRQPADAKELKGDILRGEVTSELMVLQNLAKYCKLEWLLLETTEDKLLDVVL